MTKTKKIKKTKNSKLRRQVLRTFSALTMVAAIAVAAIPVENLGTVSAKLSDTPSTLEDSDYNSYVYANMYKDGTGSNITMTDLTSSSSSSTGFSQYDVSTSTSWKKAQKMTVNGTKNIINDKYKIAINQNADGTAVITDYISSQSSVDIEHISYYNYVTFTSDDMDYLVKDIIEGDTISVQFANDDSDVAEYEYRDSNGDLKKEQKKYTLFNFSNSTLTYTTKAGYTTTTLKDDTNCSIISASGLYDSSDYADFFGTFSNNGHSSTSPNPSEPAYFRGVDDFRYYLEACNTYNDKVLNALEKYESSSKSDADWSTLNTTITDLQDGNKTTYAFGNTTKTYQELLTYVVRIELSSSYTYARYSLFYRDALCRRGNYSFSNSNSIKLQGFQIEDASDDGTTVYVVRWNKNDSSLSYSEDLKHTDSTNNSSSTERANRVDENGFLVEGWAEIVGIYDDAFSGTIVSNVVIENAGDDNNNEFQWIGNNAFADCGGLTSISIPKTLTTIGNRAFYNTGLNSITVTDDMDPIKNSLTNSVIDTIGAEAFAKTSITSLKMPYNLRTIGAGCFANNISFEGIDLSAVNGKLVIGPFAFYNCTSLGDAGENADDSVIFPSKVTVVIGAGAFSVADASTAKQKMKSFEFPTNMSVATKVTTASNFDKYEYYVPTGKNANDYILYGRKSLLNVLLPNGWGGDVPNNTFGKCESLESVILGDITYNDSQGTDITFESGADETLFKDVSNTGFYVGGSGFTTGSNPEATDVRKEIVCMRMADSVDGSVNYVPYKFLNIKKQERIEVAVGSDNDATNPRTGFYLAVIEPRTITDSDGNTKPETVHDVKTANIETYKYNSYKYTLTDTEKNSLSSELEVPAKVSVYRILGLNEGCFDDIIANIETLKIADGSIISIGASTFKNSPKLKTVYIGDSVTEIGEDAFAGCTNLQDVYFTDPSNLTELDFVNNKNPLYDFKIADGAFKTQSEFLTFYGLIADGYAPFEYAMDKNNTHMLSSNPYRNICYKSESGLTVLLDNSVSASIGATLVDYPHLMEAQLQNADELKDMIEGTSDYYLLGNLYNNVYGSKILDASEISVVNTALVIDIPSGIDSIDTATFFSAQHTTDNSANIAYLDNYEELNAKGSIKEGYYVTSPNVLSYLTNIYNIINTINTGIDNQTFKTFTNKIDVKSAVTGRLDLSRKKAYYPYKISIKDDATNTTTSKDIAKLINIEELYGNVNTAYVDVTATTNATKIPDDLEVDSTGVPGLFSGLFVEDGLGLISEDGNNINNDPTKDADLKAETTGVEYKSTSPTTTTATSDSTKNSGKTYSGSGYEVNYVEKNIWGNDHLTVVTLGDTIKSLPDYAFDSCENLVKATLGKGLTDIGALPFRGDKKVAQIDTTTKGNTKYVEQNGILYSDENGDGTMDNVVEVLESRGIVTGATTITSSKYGTSGVSSDPLLSGVSTIEKGAFSNCLNLSTVDLRDTSITSIPTGCFEGSENILNIYVPDNMRQITAERALATGNNAGEVRPVYIHSSNPNLVIDDTAFASADEGTYYVLMGPEKDSSGNISSLKELADKDPNDNITFQDDSTYVITFVNNMATPNVILGTKPSTQTDVPSAIVTQATTSAPDGWKFTGKWMYTDTAGNVYYGEDAYDNAKENRYVYAVYEPDEVTKKYSGNDVTVNVTGGGYITSSQNATTGTNKIYTNGTQTSITLPSGSYITLQANGTVFWSTGNQTYNSEFSDTQGNPVGFTIPDLVDGDESITINATIVSSDGTISGDGSGTNGSNGTDGSNGSNGSTSDGSTSSDGSTKYTVTVNYGSGSGSYAAGESVTISAYAPTSSSRVFSKWTSNNSALGFADATGATTTFIMPAADVTVTANYKTRSDDDDDDDDTVSSRPGTSTSTTTVSSTPSNASTTTTAATTTSSTSTTTPDTGDKIVITKNGVSNTDVASAQVTGSTDNFVVKISETDEANEMAQQALTNTYGSLDGLVYFPMDISLYDSTGQNKITDTYGLNVTVTMPIPDVLIQYGGNARVATTDNGNLTQLTPKFTTIDGIACISFVPPHFSPYVIYVDTSNLTAGQSVDSTPTTGDPIHPKWFAAIGMACVSVLLFVGSNGTKRRKYRTA